MPFDKPYNPDQIERRWYRYWEQQGFFAPQPEHRDQPPYCIMIPPPNVTGSLHMGHAFQDTLMDALTRYHRMRGDNTLWQPGIDHAGIATQMVVERLINADGKTRHDYGREKFVEKIWQWKRESGGAITQQLRRMGASPDWANERFTMDEGLNAAVNRVFVQLYDDGLIYRGKRLVNWDPVLHTALSDLEVLSEQEAGQLWHLRYPLIDAQADGKPYLTVATTRPETLFGDSAVAVHPEDPRYAHLVGRMVELPLTGRQIPVIADAYADPEFGSGCVKITPAHDFRDYQVWLRCCDSAVMQAQPYGGLINVFTVSAALRENGAEDALRTGPLIPSAYVGLDRYAARERLVAELDAAGLLERVAEHSLTIPRGDRSGAVVEPLLTDQWYVDLTREVQPDGRPGGKVAITEPAVAAVRQGQIEFVPDNWRKTYYQWLENIEDWCISRQIWWGHRIPAWYDDNGNVYVAADEATVRDKYALGSEVALRRDDDVLDTWFSSALWPFSTLGWPQQTERLSTFYPTSVLVTGFDIIFFWVARMIMMGLRFMQDVPFRQVYIHGLVRDAHGRKMSKSKGNTLDPIDLIDGIDLQQLIDKRTQGLMQPHLADKIARQTRRDFPQGIPSFGADALRFTFAALASGGRDINFDLDRTVGYRNFCNKIWNAARFVLLHTEGLPCRQEGDAIALSTADRWIVSRLQKTQQSVAQAIDGYRFDHAARQLHEFIWHHYCDWYLELCKPILNRADDAEPVDEHTRNGARRTLVEVLEALLRLAHPIMPYITEELWQSVAPLAGVQGATIMTQPYPQCEHDKIDPAAEEEMQWIMDFILAIRRIKGEMNVPPGRQVPILLVNPSRQAWQRVTRHHLYLRVLGKAESIEATAESDREPEAAVAHVGGLKLMIPLAGLVDKQAERRRLEARLNRLEQEIGHSEKKLNNPGFQHKAAAAVVRKEQDKLTRLLALKHDLTNDLARLSG